MGEISLKIKSTSQTFEISVNQTASISEVKDIILGKLENVAKEQLCLIFSGKILKDHETLDVCGIINGMAIHLVVRNTGTRPAPSAATTSTPTAAATTPQPTPAQPSTENQPGASLFGGLPQNFSRDPMSMANMLQQNPDMMRQMMDNPIMQALMNNPDVMRSMMTNNPQIQQIIQRNPEVGHILNDPDIMRQTMEMMRNPNMFNEMMRNHDLAIRNLQGIPGGEAALARLYTDVQEPLLNSATSAFGGNPYASSGNDEDNSSRSQRAGMENRDALPNPWDSGNSNNRQPAGGNENSRSPFGSLGGNMDQMMQSMMNDPSVVSSLMSPEMMSLMQQQLTQNPELINQMLQSNPLIQNNPALAEQMRAQLPQMMSMLSRPEFHAAMSNPRVVEALRQIQGGMEILRQEAPELARLFGMPSIPGMPGTDSSQAAPTQSSPPAAAQQDMGQLMRLMQQAMGNLNMSGAAPVPENTNFEELYAAQLEQLANMGFNNRAQNIAALRACFGDLNAAVERLLNSP